MPKEIRTITLSQLCEMADIIDTYQGVYYMDRDAFNPDVISFTSTEDRIYEADANIEILVMPDGVLRSAKLEDILLCGNFVAYKKLEAKDYE